MNNFSKSLLAVAILAASTGAANASIESLGAGNNEAFLQVYDHGMTYDLDLGPAATSNGLKAAVANLLRLDYTAFMSADANWAAFTDVANGFNAATAKYGVFVGNGNTVEFTSTNAITVKPATTVIAGMSNAISNQANNINAGSPATAADVVFNNSKLVSDLDAVKTGQWSAGSAVGINVASTVFGQYTAANAAIAYGVVGKFFSETKAATTQASYLGDFNLSAGGLTFDYAGYVPPVSAVPLPAAVWMFGAGLMGVLRLNRRKSAAI